MMMNNSSQNSGINIDLKIILDGIAQLDTSNLHLFSNEVAKMLLGRFSNLQEEKEWTLIYQIYTIVPPHIKNRYDKLTPKLEQETLSDKEREEFLDLNDKMENYSAERLKLLLQLANIRKISLPQVMEQLGLQKPTYV